MSTTEKLKKIQQFQLQYPALVVRLEFAFPPSNSGSMVIPIDSYDELELFSTQLQEFPLISKRTYDPLMLKNVNLSIRSLPKLNFYCK